jgi:AraC-like DNA-binding protein
MKLDYLLDITEESDSIAHTPSLASQQLPFYIHNFGHYCARSRYYTEREGLDNYLLIYTVSGSGFISYRDREYALRSGQVFFIDCNEYHFYKTGNTGNWNIKWVHFNGTSCKYYFNMINEDSLNVITLSNFKEFERFLDEIPGVIHKSDIHTDVKLSMLMTNVLTELAVNRLNPTDSKGFAQQTVLVEKAINFMQAHYAENTNIRDIVKHLHVSEFYFMHLFKRHTGVGAYEYLTNFKINKSKLLLNETDLTIYDIAYKVGFNNVNNYIRDFKKLVGTTPLKYRNYWIK